MTISPDKSRRLDQWLVDLGLAESRTKAQRLIASGAVQVRASSPGSPWTTPTQSSLRIFNLDATAVQINPLAEDLRFVSRGGLKLEGALNQLPWNVRGWRALDVGISTGGFTDCLLRRGCAEVVGLDVGRGQLSAALRDDPRVRSFEAVNVRNIQAHPEVMTEVEKGIDLCVVDVSFISLTLVLPPLTEVLASQKCRLLVLVKPQFELGPEALDKNGIVRDSELQKKATQQILRALEKCGFSQTTELASEIKGQDGNQEYFIAASRTHS